jgi:hypothetical protein
MHKFFFLIITLLLTSNLYSQCWKSIGRMDNDSVPTSFAIKEDGTLWAWGRNSYGLFGNGNKTSSSVPVKVNNDTDWQSISYSSGSVKGVKTDGTLWAWGGNLGDGTKNSSLIPKQIGSEKQWKEVASDYRTLALKNNGSLWYWDGEYYLTPTMVGTDTDWKTIFSNYAIKNNGTLWVIYLNYVSGKYIAQLSQVGDENDFKQVDVNYAIKTDGTLWFYDDNSANSVGASFQNSKIQVNNSNWQSISCGNGWESNGFGITTDGALWSLTRGTATRIGNETNWKSITVEHIGNGLNDGKGGTKIAIKTDGTVYTWGTECCGELGNSYNDSPIILPTILNTPGCLASVDDISMSEDLINVYPNPTDGILTISSKDKVVENITIKNAEGRTVLFIQNLNGVIDIQKLDKGLYFLEWNENSNVKSKLIIKE